MMFFFSSVLSVLFMFCLHEPRNIFLSLRTPKMVWWHLQVSVFRLINSPCLLKTNFKQTLFIVHSLKYFKILLEKNPAQLWVGGGCLYFSTQIPILSSAHNLQYRENSTCIPFFLFLLIFLIEVNKCSNGILIHLVQKPVQSPLVYSKCLKMCWLKIWLV